MKILILTNLYPSQREPTRGVFNFNRFLPLSRLCETRILAPLPWWSRLSRPREWTQTPRETGTGIEVAFPTYWSLPGLPRLHGVGMYASLRSRVAALRRAFPFDAILAAWAYPDGVAAAHIARDLRCPLVTMVLGSDINEHAQRPGLRKQIRRGLVQAEIVIAVSQALRDRVVEIGISPERVIVQHNGVDGARFTLQDRRSARERLGLPLDRPLLCYVGNFKPEKGVATLIEALGHLRRSGARDVLLSLVGNGELEAVLRSRARALDLETQVRFCGRRPHEEIPDWISAADALCLPSYREGCPNVVLEALASGRPVIASRVGGVPEILNAANGIMMSPGDPVALAEGLLEALARPWDPEALRATVPCLSWDQFALTLRDTLASALRGARPLPQAASGQAKSIPG
jgi:glycosyltransferase involved in cell wall biosynthesis